MRTGFILLLAFAVFVFVEEASAIPTSKKEYDPIQALKDAMQGGPEPPSSPPLFSEQLQNLEQVREGQDLSLFATLEHVGDEWFAGMKLEWFFNGNAITIDEQRFRTGSIMAFYDSGIISLEIVGVTASDQGIYICLATNALGQAVTGTMVEVNASDDEEGDTMPSELSKVPGAYLGLPEDDTFKPEHYRY